MPSLNENRWASSQTGRCEEQKPLPMRGVGRKIPAPSRPVSSIVTVANELSRVVIYCTT